MDSGRKENLDRATKIIDSKSCPLPTGGGYVNFFQEGNIIVRKWIEANKEVSSI